MFFTFPLLSGYKCYCFTTHTHTHPYGGRDLMESGEKSMFISLSLSLPFSLDHLLSIYIELINEIGPVNSLQFIAHTMMIISMLEIFISCRVCFFYTIIITNLHHGFHKISALKEIINSTPKNKE